VPHLVREDAQRPRQRRAEFLRLLEKRCEGTDLVEAQSLGERLQRVVEAAAGAQLELDEL
jgi:hypothetical protein